MTLQEFKDNYSVTDGEVLTLNLEYGSQNSNGFDTLSIKVNGKKFLSKGKIEHVIFSLQFRVLTEFYYNEKFDCKTISQSTLTRTSLGHFYLSLDPFHEDSPSEEDNMIVKSKELFFIDPEGIEHQIT
jgi:hypothetical protein